MHPEGFEIPIHQSAIKAQLVMGLPRQLALVLYTIVAALTLPLSTWYAIPPGLFLHAVFAAAARRDPAVVYTTPFTISGVPSSLYSGRLPKLSVLKRQATSSLLKLDALI